MKPIIYLKSEKYGLQFSAYNPNNLSRINVYKDTDLTIEKYDDLETFEWNLTRDINTDYKLSTKEDFDAQFIAFGKNLNELSKEL